VVFNPLPLGGDMTKWIIFGVVALGLVVYSFSPRWEDRSSEDEDLFI